MNGVHGSAVGTSDLRRQCYESAPEVRTTRRGRDAVPWSIAMRRGSARWVLALGVATAGLMLGGVAYARVCERVVPSVDAQEPPSLLIVMDASKSMSKPTGDGTTRLQAAKAALRTLVKDLPDGSRVGLRLYGHRVSGATRAEGCRDTELVAPVGELDRAALAATDRLLRGRRLHADRSCAARRRGRPPGRGSGVDRAGVRRRRQLRPAVAVRGR